MPKGFDRCVKRGGRVRTLVPKKGVYVRVCFDKETGKSYAGEVHRKKKKSK